MNYTLRTAVGAIALAITSLLPMTAHAENDMVTICHAKGNGDYVTLTIAEEAVYGNGNAGHFSENGTPASGHEDDYFGQCESAPEPTTPPTEPPVTDPPSTEPPATEPPVVPPVVTDPPATTPPFTVRTLSPEELACFFPQSYAPDAPCGPNDPCLTLDGILYSDGFELGSGDDNDRKGTTLWTIMKCYVEVLDPGATPPASAPLPPTGGTLNVALAALAAFALGGSLYLITRRKTQ